MRVALHHFRKLLGLPPALAPVAAIVSLVVAAGAQTVISTVPVPGGPFALGVNPTTNRVYVTNRVYLANNATYTVSVIDGSTNTVVGAPIPVGADPLAMAVNATTNRVYVANLTDNTVSVIDGSTNTVVGTPIPVGRRPFGVAVNATTNRVYVTNGNGVSVIDGSSNTVIGAIPVRNPEGVAVNPTTNRVYVTNVGGTVSVIDGSTNTVIGAPIPVGANPQRLGVNPTTNRVYVANFFDNTVSVIDGSSNAVIGAPIPVGTFPVAVAVNPTTDRVYVANRDDNTLTVIDGSRNTVIGAPIPVGTFANGVAVNPTTNRVYVTNGNDDTLSVIDGSSNTPSAQPQPAIRWDAPTPADQTMFNVGIGTTQSFTVAASSDTGLVTLAHSDLPDGMSCDAVVARNAVATTCQVSPSAVGFRQVMFDAVLSDGTAAGARTFAAVGSGRYVAMGDSYSSGEGAADFPSANYVDGTDQGGENKCHRKLNAYGPLLADDTGYSVDGTGPQFDLVACSGATTLDMFARSCQDVSTDTYLQRGDGTLERIDQYGQPIQVDRNQCTPNNVRDNTLPGEPPQLDALCGSENCVDPNVTLVTVTIGGNDADFVSVLTTCVNANTDDDCAKQLVKGVEVSDWITSRGLESRLANVYKAIHSRAPSARILVVGYPRIFPANPTEGCYYGSRPSLVSPGEVYLSIGDLKWLNQQGEIMNSVIKQAVSASGVAEYVDTSEVMNGHEACFGGSQWMNDLQLHPNFDDNCDVTDHVVHVQCESFHPNGDGYKALKNAVVKQYRQPAAHPTAIVPPDAIAEAIILSPDGQQVSVTFTTTSTTGP